MTKKNQKHKTGPIPDRVKINQNWKEAVKDALQKKRPKDGWPKPEKGKQEEE